MATSFLGANAAGPALLPLLGSSAILSFDLWETVFYSTFVRTNRDEIPDRTISKFWERSLTPALLNVFGLYGSTAALGAAVWWTADKGGLLRKYAGLGTLFTAGHFVFGYPIAKTIEQIVHEPAYARQGQWRWLQIHAMRTMAADIPAFVCFLAAVWHGW